MYEMCSYCYNAFFTDPDFEQELYDTYWEEQNVSSSTSVKICECGGNVVANNTHSSWCPLFEEEYYGTD